MYLVESVKEQNVICNQRREGLPEAKTTAANGVLMDHARPYGNCLCRTRG